VATLLEQELPKPDLVIYLQSNTDRLMTNIKRRNKNFEKHISHNYLKRLNESYNEYFFRYTETPLLVINSSDMDFVHNEEDLNDLVDQIMRPPAGVKYYVPMKR